MTHSFFLSILAVSWSLLLFLKYVQNDIARANETELGAFFLSEIFLHGIMNWIYKSSMLLSILDISISPVLSCVVFSPYTVINTSWKRLFVFPAYVPTKPLGCSSIYNGSDEPLCKHKSEKRRHVQFGWLLDLHSSLNNKRLISYDWRIQILR